MKSRLVKIAPAATLVLWFLALALILFFFDPMTKNANGLPTLRFDFLSYRDAILIVQGVFSFTVLFGGIWAFSIIRNVTNIMKQDRAETEAIQEARARKLQQEKRAEYNRQKNKKRRK